MLSVCIKVTNNKSDSLITILVTLDYYRKQEKERELTNMRQYDAQAINNENGDYIM